MQLAFDHADSEPDFPGRIGQSERNGGGGGVTGCIRAGSSRVGRTEANASSD